MNIEYANLNLATDLITAIDATAVEHIFYNIDFKTLLGYNYELGAKYNIILKSVMVDPATTGVIGTQNCEMRLLSNCFNFYQYQQIGGSTQKCNYASFPKINVSNLLDYELGSSTLYFRNRTTTFQLLAPIGNILIQYIDVITNTLNRDSTTIPNQIIMFDIIKIPKDDTQIKYFPMYANLDLNWFDSDNQSGSFPTPTGNNNIPYWTNVNLKTVLGEIFELYSNYSVCITAIMNTRANVGTGQRREAPQVTFSNMKPNNIGNNKQLQYIQTYRNSFSSANFSGLNWFGDQNANFTLLMDGAINRIDVFMRLCRPDGGIAVTNAYYNLKLRFSKLKN